MVSESDLLAPLPTERASVGALARDLRSGAVLASTAPDRPLPPASNGKLLTTMIALDRLGPEYRFETRVHAAGERDGDRLGGDLLLEGRGAPDLAETSLRRLAERVREAGVRTVTGDLLLDGSWFGSRKYGPGWCVDDPRHAYGAPNTALALDRNVVEVTIADPDGTGAFEASVEPDTGILDIVVDVEPTDDEADLSVRRERESNQIRVSGIAPKGKSVTETAPVGNPLAHIGAAFRDALADAGVTISGRTRIGSVPADAERLATHESAPLVAVCREMNVPSDNFLAETIARTVATEGRGEGTWTAWADLASAFLDERGVEPVRFRDGSGLSRYNLLPARGLASLLAWSVEQSWGEEFLGSLPVAGEDGTLSNRMDDVDAVVRAKTGTLTGTSALSGVIEDDGEPAIVFSVLLSNLTGDVEESARDAQDEFVRRLAETL